MTLRILVSGSRKYADPDAFDGVVREAIGTTRLSDVIIISGAAKGLDRIAEDWGDDHDVTVERYRADWKRYGNGAGGERNQVMVDTGADICLAFPLDGSIGTYDCIRRAKKAGIPVTIVRPVTDAEPDDDLLFDWS